MYKVGPDLRFFLVQADPAEAKQAASEIIGMDLVTPQTGPGGQKVKSVWVENATDIDRELYLGIVLDRAQSRLVVMASQAGGMDIEEVAATTPEKSSKKSSIPVLVSNLSRHAVSQLA